MRAEATLVATPILPLDRCPRVEGREYILIETGNDPIVAQYGYLDCWGDMLCWASFTSDGRYTHYYDDEGIVGWIDFRGEALPEAVADREVAN